MTELCRFVPSEYTGPSEFKTLWVTNSWPDELRPHWGSFVRSQAKSLWELNLDVDVLVVRGFVTMKAYFSTLPEVRRRTRDSKYDLVHAHFGHTAAMVATALRHPLVISFCGEDLLGAPRAHGNTLKSTVESAIFRHLPGIADATITKSLEMELQLPKKYQADNTVLPNGVDTNLFMPIPQIEARDTLGWRHDERVALFLGDPSDSRKRVELAEQAMIQVQKTQPDARLEIAFGIKPAVVPTLMNAADCLVFPSRSEGSPNAVKEAMAAALPIVATPVGDVPERFKDVEGCFVCQPHPMEFSYAILKAFEMGGSSLAARTAVEAISIETIAGRLRDIYLSVL
jgi:glycosyltransferase involved in cell wall biosynthesis